MMNPAYRGLLSKDRRTSETGHGLGEAINGAQVRIVDGFLDRPTATGRRFDAMGHFKTRASAACSDDIIDARSPKLTCPHVEVERRINEALPTFLTSCS
jgi:hypothetical protein